MDTEPRPATAPWPCMALVHHPTAARVACSHPCALCIPAPDAQALHVQYPSLHHRMISCYLASGTRLPTMAWGIGCSKLHAQAIPTCARPHLVYHRYTTRNLDNAFMHMISVCPIFLMLLCLNNLAIVPRRMHEPCFIALVLHGCNWYVGGRVPSL